MNSFLMRMIAICFCSLLLFQSCKTKSVGIVSTKTDTNLGANNTVENYSNNKVDFSTLYIKSNVKYDNGKQNHNVAAEIKIKKDEQILVSIRFLGITMAKAMITPKSVSYYEKMNGSYYEGDFSALSQMLGTELDFYKVQNMLLGRAMDDLRTGKYTETVSDQTIQLNDVLDTKLKKSFVLDATTYLLINQEIEQPSESRKIQIAYSNHNTYTQGIVPLNVLINASQAKGKTEINLEYNTVTFNVELSFPYSVPNDYKRIIIK
ncbi:MAG: DUF4292 domain-containing protein [Flavobacterium sp.]|nr:DUF4292 domain-containing protein [Flavobacterium sp.]